MVYVKAPANGFQNWSAHTLSTASAPSVGFILPAIVPWLVWRMDALPLGAVVAAVGTQVMAALTALVYHSDYPHAFLACPIGPSVA
jgi:hypothetical protein